MKKSLIQKLKSINIDHIIFLALIGPESSEGYMYIRNIAKEKAKKIIKIKKPIKF